MTILIVDDSPENLYLLEQVLQGHGWQTVSAGDGRQALDQARAHPPDLIISDILMPVMDGFELCRLCGSDDTLSRTPFIFHTAVFTDSKDERFALSLGADRFVTQPQKPEALIRIVEDVLAEYREEPPGSARSREENAETLREYNAVLLHKLAQKTGELENEIGIRKRAEADLAMRNAILTAQLEATRDAVMAVDETGALMFLNKRFIEIWGLPYQPVPAAENRTLRDVSEKLIDPARFRHDVLRQIGDRDDHSSLEASLADGRILASYSTPIIGADGGYFGRIWYFRDMTEQRTSDKKLALQAELLDSAIDSIFLLDAGGTIAYANRNAAELRGYAMDEILGMNMRDLTDGENAEAFPKQIQSILKEGFALYESVHVKKNGTPFNVEILARVMNIDGQPHILTSNRDVTGRRRVLKALSESEERFRTLFEVSPDVMYTVSLDGRFIALNPAFEAVTGFSREDWIGKPFTDILHPEDVQPTLDYIASILTGGPHRSVEARIRVTSGAYRLGEFSSAPFERGGKPAGIHGIARDITKRKQVERELGQYRDNLERLVADRTAKLRKANTDLNVEIEARKKTEERLNRERTLLRTLIDTLPDQIYAKDRQGRYTLANIKLLRSFGFTDFRELLGRTDFDFHPGERAERFFREEQKIIKAEQPLLDREEETEGNADEKRWLLISKVPFRDETGVVAGLVGINRDVTRLKKAEQNLQQAKIQAETANAAKSSFLAGISHEIRTPMNAVLGFSQLMLGDPELTGKQRERLTVINRSGEHLISLLNDVLDITKIETGHTSVEFSTFNLPGLIGEIEAMFRGKTDEKRLNLTFSGTDALPAAIVSDEMKIRQILINLVGNAVKFTDSGGVEVRSRLEKTAAPEPMLIIEIEDTGRGIAPEDRDGIFREFEQGTSGKTIGGTGLGLSISRHFARLLNGDITLETEPGAGSVFRLRVPIRVSDKPGGEPRIQRGRITGVKPGQLTFTVLIADDNTENRKFLAEMLSGAGFGVTEAVNGGEAVLRFGELGPDLIFMDINMDVMDGYEATARIRASAGGAAVPIIAVTANALAETREKIVKAGMNAVIVKPFKERDIFAALGNFLGVEFAYQNEETAREAVPEANIERELEKIPRDLAALLTETARKLEIKKLLALIDRTETTSPAAAVYLRNLAKKYRYDRLIELLERRGPDGG